MPRSPAAAGAGDLGIGDLGPSAFDWIDALVRAKQSWWQILPLGPTGPTASPYQSYSAFAGNPNLISPEWLARDGLLATGEFRSARFFPYAVDFSAGVPFKLGLIDRAWDQFRARGSAALRSEYERFVRQHEPWLDDFALFMALKEAHGGSSWYDWPEPLRRRQRAALADARRELAVRMDRERFRQFEFFRQWSDVRAYAKARGVRIIGDIPIFVNGDSADVWANPDLFLLDEENLPQAVAGVPPDYFNEDGQLWGNPLYDWDAHRATGYEWWADRIRMTLSQVDLVRVDHFRAFAAAWHVPADAITAKSGSWVPGPGAELFEAIRAKLGGLPLIAEDLGLITADVHELRESLGLPGMCVLQFAFGGGSDNRYLPHNYDPHCAVYTGTHDNDTTRGWYLGSSEYVRHHVRQYVGRDGTEIAWDLLRMAWASIADLAVAPLQDVLDLGGEARMNTPGVPEGNWGWRLAPGALREEALVRLGELTKTYGREP